ncbi:hypothetical protein [Prosthecobacter sp.]|uniref:hypothetical protein n=1 Tax=Prosthecobacter sp. TaxID=1965333 RepID=UPI003782EDE8
MVSTQGLGRLMQHNGSLPDANILYYKLIVKIQKAFTLEHPSVDLAWGLQEEAFRKHFKDVSLTQITAGHLKTRCVLFGGLEADVHFHFNPRQNGRFSQVELYRSPQHHRQKAFDDWQTRLIRLFGQGTEQRSQLPMHTAYKWVIDSVSVIHEWYYHCGEHERILVATKR